MTESEQVTESCTRLKLETIIFLLITILNISVMLLSNSKLQGTEFSDPGPSESNTEWIVNTVFPVSSEVNATKEWESDELNSQSSK